MIIYKSIVIIYLHDVDTELELDKITLFNTELVRDLYITSEKNYHYNSI